MARTMREILEGAQRQLTEGYTHYWRHEGFDDAAWKALVAEAKQIVKRAWYSAGIKVGGPMGTGQPKFTDNYIALNGAGDEAFESFLLTKKPQDFKFTKTQHRPYDAVVVSILAAARDLGQAFDPSSDGGPEAIRRIF